MIYNKSEIMLWFFNQSNKLCNIINLIYQDKEIQMKSLNHDIIALYEPYADKHGELITLTLDNEELEITSNLQIIGKVGGKQNRLLFGAKHISNSQLLALKKIKIAQTHKTILKALLKELKIIRLLNDKKKCQNIIQIDTIIRPRSRQQLKDIYLVEQFMTINLDSILRAYQVLPQNNCKDILFQILKGVQFIHSSNVVHKNLKPKKILFNEDGVVKLSSFKHARRASFDCLKGDNDDHQCGNYTYEAPELLLDSNEYTKSVDIWSVGCIFGQMLRGKPLFHGQDCYHQLELIVGCVGTPLLDNLSSKISQDGIKNLKKILKIKKTTNLATIFKNTSSQAIDLLQKLLKFNPSERITAQDALRHPFFSGLFKQEELAQNSEIQKAQFEFEKHNLTTEQIKDLIYEQSILYNNENFRNVYYQKIKKNQSLIGHIITNSNSQIIDPITSDDF